MSLSPNSLRRLSARKGAVGVMLCNFLYFLGNQMSFCYRPAFTIAKIIATPKMVRSLAVAGVYCLALGAPSSLLAGSFSAAEPNADVVRVIGCDGQVLAEYSGQTGYSGGIRGISGLNGLSLELKGVEHSGVGSSDSALVLTSIDGTAKSYQAVMSSGSSTAKFGPFEGAGTWKLCPRDPVEFSEAGFVAGSGSSNNSGSLVLASLAGVGGIVAIGSGGGNSDGSGSAPIVSGSGTGEPVAAMPNNGAGSKPSDSSNPGNHSSGGGSDVPRCASVDCGLDEDPTPLSPIS